MKRTRPRTLAARAALVALLLGSGGCLRELHDLQAPAQVLGPVVLDGKIVLADADAGELVSLGLDAGHLDSIERLTLLDDPTAVAPLVERSEVLGLSAETERLVRVSTVDGSRQAWDLGAAFTTLSVSEDGTAALAWYLPGTATGVFTNANEIGWIDLDAPGADPGVPGEAVRRTLPSLGGSPSAVYLSPQVGPQGARYAFVLSRDHVAVLDLDRAEAPERSIPLVGPTAGDVRTPLAVTFAVDPDGATLWAVVTTQQGNAAYALRVTADPAAPAGEAPFDVLVTQLAGLGPGGDVELLTLPDGGLVALMTDPQRGTLTLSTLRTGESLVVTPGTGVGTIERYEDGGRPMALVYSVGQARFHVVDIADIETRKDKAYRTRSARAGIQRVVAVPGTPLFVAVHSGTTGVSVLDTETDRITPFESTGAIQDLHLAADLDRLIVLTNLGGTPYIVSLDLLTLHADAAELPQAVGGTWDLVVLEGSSTVVAWHGASGGRLVSLPIDRIEDDTLEDRPGFLLTGILDRAAAEEN